MKSSRSTSHMGGGKKKSGKSSSHAHSMHIRRGHKGGFIAVHHAEPGAEDMQDQEHPLPDIDALKAHLQDSMGDQPPAEPPASMAQAGPGPGAAGPAAGGGMPQVGM